MIAKEDCFGWAWTSMELDGMDPMVVPMTEARTGFMQNVRVPEDAENFATFLSVQSIGRMRRIMRYAGMTFDGLDEDAGDAAYEVGMEIVSRAWALLQREDPGAAAFPPAQGEEE